MRLLYLKPELKDLSQGSRIAFVRQFRRLTQDYIAGELGLSHDNKRRIRTRYEKGNRCPKDDRTLELSKILNVSFNAIKKYDFNKPIDLIYMLMWLEELIPNYQIDLSITPNIKNEDIPIYQKFMDEWNVMRRKRKYREISYDEYLEWKFKYELGDDKL